MARLPRLVIPGQPQHVIVRGNNRGDIFRTEADFRFYLEKLQLACDKHDCKIHAYVLMTNHVHLLITPQAEDGLSKLIQMLGRYYVQFYNYTYNRTGTLWEGRYKSTLIDSEAYLLTCMRYIELNPVRAGMVKHPSEYPWSSYRCNALGEIDNLVVPHIEFMRLGQSVSDRHASYRQLFKAHISEYSMNEIREATNKAWVLGTERFKRSLQKKVDRQVEPSAKGGDRKSMQYHIENNLVAFIENQVERM